MASSKETNGLGFIMIPPIVIIILLIVFRFIDASVGGMERLSKPALYLLGVTAVVMTVLYIHTNHSVPDKGNKWLILFFVIFIAAVFYSSIL